MSGTTEQIECFVAEGGPLNALVLPEAMRLLARARLVMDHIHRDGVSSGFVKTREDIAAFLGMPSESEPPDPPAEAEGEITMYRNMAEKFEARTEHAERLLAEFVARSDQGISLGPKSPIFDEARALLAAEPSLRTRLDRMQESGGAVVERGHSAAEHLRASLDTQEGKNA